MISVKDVSAPQRDLKMFACRDVIYTQMLIV